MLVTIVDDFLPKDYFEHLKSLLMAEDVPNWCLANYTISKSVEEREENMQMVHMVYSDSLVYSDFFGQLQPLFDALNIAIPVRIKANMTFREQSNDIELGWHTDFAGKMAIPNITTAILYFNDTDGGTKLEDGNIVECKENRLVKFPMQVSHTAMSMTNAKSRVVLNINYIEGVEPDKEA